MNQRILFRFLLVGLPVGLAGSVGIALYLYYHPLGAFRPSRLARPSAESLLRKSPTEQDIREYRRILGSELAVRTAAQPGSLVAASNWLASTLGPTNMGHVVGIQEIAVAPQGARNVLIELPGTREKDEVVVICTSYATGGSGQDGAAGTAVLMTLANAFVGLPQSRTLLFAFTPGEGATGEGVSPIAAALQSLKINGKVVRGVLDLRVLATTVPVPAAVVPGVQWKVFVRAERDGWTGEVKEAVLPRKPAGVNVVFLEAADGIGEMPGLAWWDKAGLNNPWVVLALKPAAPNDESSVIAWARSLEGIVQALANR